MPNKLGAVSLDLSPCSHMQFLIFFQVAGSQKLNYREFLGSTYEHLLVFAWTICVNISNSFVLRRFTTSLIFVIQFSFMYFALAMGKIHPSCVLRVLKTSIWDPMYQTYVFESRIAQRIQKWVQNNQFSTPLSNDFFKKLFSEQKNHQKNWTFC